MDALCDVIGNCVHKPRATDNTNVYPHVIHHQVSSRHWSLLSDIGYDASHVTSVHNVKKRQRLQILVTERWARS